MKVVNVKSGERYVVTSHKSYHYGQVVMAIDPPEQAIKNFHFTDFIFVKAADEQVLKLRVLEGEVALRPVALEDEIRTLSDTEMRDFLNEITNGKDGESALRTAKGIDVTINRPVWNIQYGWRKSCPFCGAVLPYEISQENPDAITYWDSNYCRICGKRVYEKEE